MTLTFPRDMPSAGAMGLSFDPERVDYLSPEAGGRLGAVSAGWPRWLMQIDLNAMTMRDGDIWRAWLAAQRGAQRRFYARDLDRPVPRLHADGRPFTTTPGGWSQAIAGDGTAYLTLTGMMTGTTLSEGDYVGFGWDGWKRDLVRAVEQVTAGADGSMTIAVEPPVWTATPAAAASTLVRPTCLMRLDMSQTKLARSGLGYINAGGLIAAAQDLVA